MPTRTALIPADVPSDLQVVFSDLVADQDYLLQNVSEAGQILKYSEQATPPAATDRAHLLGSFQRTGFSLDGTNRFWAWGAGRGVWVAVTEGS